MTLSDDRTTNGHTKNTAPLFSARKESWHYKQLIFPLLTGVTCLIFGIAAISMQQIHDLTMQSQRSAQHTIKLLDNAIDYSSQTNEKIISLNDKSCSDINKMLKKYVASTPYVRTLNLVKDNFLYCTSFSGDTFIYSPGNYTLKLVTGTPIMPTRGGLIVRNNIAKSAALSVIDGLYLKILFGMAKYNNDLYMKVGDIWVDSNGMLMKRAPVLEKTGGYTIESKKYPYIVYSGYVNVDRTATLFMKKPILAGFVIMLSLLATIYTWFMVRKPKSLLSELSRALKNNELVPYLQPLIDSQSGRMLGAEVLVRWQHPELGMIPPDAFISIAEESHLIAPITTSLMQQVAKKMQPYASQLPDNFHFGFNISAQQCSDDTLIADCLSFIDSFPSSNSILLLELTERVLLEDTDANQTFFHTIKKMGIPLALDDFGTGQSSLAYIQQFNFDFLKIDQRFVSMINSDSVSAPILDMLITLSKSLNMRLVAEGIETEAQRDYLRSQGVDLLQGYLFSRPITIEQFVSEWLS
ncbi:diguanylate phosphodiesterase [Aeromonas veronii]|uniref:EAL domain-containing protein n=1 Tax=Aeromonas veronii TaxID=654 RepID=UPI00111848D0|nr:EAL domain-containing protein [Aeromonas veronii]TNI78521.1 diguanylate phosphodiesterase [Aeromonas veronii]